MKQTLLVGMMAITMLPVSAGFTGEPPQDKTPSKRGWLGVSIQDVSKDLAEENNLKAEDGAFITEVQDESPADSVGLKRGDVIMEFGGRKIYDADDLAKSVSRTEPGTRSTVVVLRNGERKTFTVSIGKLPRRTSHTWFMGGDGPRFRMFHGGGGMLGLSTITLNEQLAKYFGAPNDEGVLVEMVKKGSPADKAGIVAGDVILKVGNRAVDEVEDIWKGLEKYDEGEMVDVELLRKGTRKTVKVEMVEMEGGPWGFASPAIPATPKIHVFPRSEDFEYDFDTEVAPQLERLERKIKSITPKLERDIQRKIRSVIRTTSV